MNNDYAESQHIHQVVIDGNVIYEGNEWASVFLEASKNPENGTIVHLEDGKPGATFGAPLAPEALRDRQTLLGS